MTKKKKLIIICAAMLIFFNLTFAAIYFLILSPAKTTAEDSKKPADMPVAVKPDSIEIGDDYYSIHFSYNNAVELCLMEAKSRNSNLIQASVNELSSRFNTSTSMYFIKLDSHVGTATLYDEKEHICDIDPKTQGVAFYKEITRRKAVRPKS